MTDKSTDLSQALNRIEREWEPDDGCLYRLRQGDYDATSINRVIELLSSIEVDDNTLLPRRFVSLTWWIPTFMEWQVERVDEEDGDVDALKRDIDRMRNVLDEVLGVP